MMKSTVRLMGGREATRRAQRLAAGALFVTLVACGAAPPVATQPEATLSVPSASAAPRQSPPKGETGTTLRLIDAGATPRRALRYRFNASQNETATLELHTAYSIEGKSDSEQVTGLPVMRFTLAVEPKSVTPDGDVHYEYRLMSADTASTASSKADVAAAIETMMKEMRGLAGTGDTSSRGLSKNSTFVRPESVSSPAVTDPNDAPAVSGTVTVTALSTGAVSATFGLEFPSGSLHGTFSAPVCDFGDGGASSSGNSCAPMMASSRRIGMVMLVSV